MTKVAALVTLESHLPVSQIGFFDIIVTRQVTCWRPNGRVDRSGRHCLR